MTIPNSVIGCIDTWLGIDWPSMFSFAMNEHMLQVDLPPMPGDYLTDEMTPWDERMKCLAQQDEFITFYQDVVGTLIQTIDFMATSFAVLVPLPNGGFRLIPRDADEYYAFDCHVWAPMVNLRELKTTQWLNLCSRRGLWRNRHVDILLAVRPACTIKWRRYITLTHALEHRGLDLSYRVLAHVEYDGSVVGFLSELSDGDSPTYHGRALLYDAFQQLESANILSRIPIYRNTLLVLNGKLRITYDRAGLFQVWSGSEPAHEIAAARKVHWENLENYMLGLRFEAEYNFRPTSEEPLYSWKHKTVRLLAYLPTPEKPIFLDIALNFPSKTKFSSKWAKHKRYQRGHSQKHSLLLPVAEDKSSTSRALVHSDESDEDAPHARVSLEIRRVRPRSAFIPYARTATASYSNGLRAHITQWDGTSDMTSESRSSIEASPLPISH